MKILKKDEMLLVKLFGENELVLFIKESSIRDKNLLVQLISNKSKVWIRESQIL